MIQDQLSLKTKWTLILTLFLLSIPVFSKQAEFRYRWQNKEINKIVRCEARKHNIKPAIIFNLIEAESSGRSRIVGKVIQIKYRDKLIYTRAIGLMQIIPEYHYKGNANDLFNAKINIKTGCKILAGCIKKAKGNYINALRYYNGQVFNRDDKYIKKILKF